MEPIVCFTCPPPRHDLEPHPYVGPETACAACEEPVRAGDDVVIEDGEIICAECDNDAAMYATIMRGGF